jgi:hypothetical protein
MQEKMSLGPFVNLRSAIESLLQWAHPPSMHKQLDELLARNVRCNMSKNAVRSWARGAQGRDTWLTHAVWNADVELVAILIYYGADPLQKYYA